MRHRAGSALLCVGQADLQAVDLAMPAFSLGFGDPIEHVVADLELANSLGRLGAEE
ncbi:hypothetical protein [Streptomyces sp. ME109]|uniref:hypothetical protein n=1 Tax=Streptomyces sp. me109 TaxID=1827853 RepID=UPI001651ADBB|nr:hypothetical protein [Streptomyces sp. me109]